jgi:hypothetical protein
MPNPLINNREDPSRSLVKNREVRSPLELPRVDVYDDFREYKLFGTDYLSVMVKKLKGRLSNNQNQMYFAREESSNSRRFAQNKQGRTD